MPVTAPAETWRVETADNLAYLPTLPENSVDAVVCDPPYGLSREPDIAEVLTCWLAGRPYKHTSNGFMGRSWDAFVPGPETWREVYRVLKPGGHLLCFAGTRTHDLMGIALRLAGFELRDTIAAYGLQWLYGSGFPKGLDIGKALDKALGAEREVVGRGRWAGRESVHDLGIINDDAWRPDGAVRGQTVPATDDAKRWEGWNVALKPAVEPILLCRKPLSERNVAANVLRHGTGGINVDGCRVGNETRPVMVRTRTVVRSNAMENPCTGGTGSGELTEAGRWPPNALFIHSPSCNGECVPGCPVAELDRQSGPLISGDRAQGVRKGMGYHGAAGDGGPFIVGDTGGASRFFPTFRYQAKADTAERNIGLPQGERNTHPTCKPVELMRWLCRLVTPPGGLVLDPFAGSGTTGMAALREGFRFLGVEKDAEHAATARLRIEGDAPLLNAPTEILPAPTSPVLSEPEHAQEAML